MQNGALVSLCNKYNQTPIDKARPELSRRLIDLAGKLDQDLEKIPYQTQLWPVGQTKPNTMRLHDKHNDLDMKVCITVIFGIFHDVLYIIYILVPEYPWENSIWTNIRFVERKMERFRSRCKTSQTTTKCYLRQWKIAFA